MTEPMNENCKDTSDRSTIAYVYCEECAFEREYKLPLSMTELGDYLKADSAEHSKTACKAMAVLSGSPKDA